MRATIVVAAVAFLAANELASQESRPTTRPAKAVPAPRVDQAEPAPSTFFVLQPFAVAGQAEAGLRQRLRVVRQGQRVTLNGAVVLHGAGQGGVLQANGELIEYRPSPLLTGDYAEALRALDEARARLQTASDSDEAFEALEAATKALMNARAALWKLKDAEQKAQKPTDTPAVPRRQGGG